MSHVVPRNRAHICENGDVMGRGRVAFLAGSIAFLAAALFLIVTPPGYNSDEPSHFTRLGGLVGGQLLGRQVHNLDAYSYKTIPQRERVRVESGIYSVDPDYMYIIGAPCNLRQYDMPACPAPLPPPAGQTAADQVSQHAHTAPTSYLIPAAFSAAGWSPRSTFYLARLGVAFEAASLVALAFLCVAPLVSRRRLVAIAGGFAGACSPLLLSIAGSVTTSAFEIFGSLSLAVLTWAVVRRPADSSAGADWLPRACWLYAFIACALTRSVGSAFAVLAIGAGLLSAGGTVRQLVGNLGRWVTASVVILAGAGFAWDSKYTVHMKSTASLFSWAAFRRDLTAVRVGSRDWANKLGWNDVHMPLIVVGGFLLVALFWVVLAIRTGGRPWLWRTSLLAVAYVALALVIARELEPTGFAMQSRFLLPGLCLLPVAAGLRLARADEPSEARSGRLRYSVAVWAVLSVVAAFYVLRRNVVGEHGKLWFFAVGGYRPLGGWPLTIVAVVAFFTAVGVSVRWLGEPGASTTAADDGVYETSGVASAGTRSPG